MRGMIHIVGIGDDGAASLSARTRAIVEGAELLMGGERHLAFFPDHRAEKILVKSNLAEIADRARTESDAGRRVVVLASGDPLFYGIGSYLIGKLGRDRVEIIPHVSAMQLAFARAGFSWQDAALVSVHGKPVKNLFPAVEDADVIGIFTDEENSPSAIARHLIEKGLANFEATVCENLDGSAERIRTFALAALASVADISSLNIVILRRLASPPPSVDLEALGPFGIPDELFVYRQPKKGLITKIEIRVLALSKMAIRPDAIVWDIGAGSGSVTVESARLASRGHVYAIEKNKPDFELIRTNLERFRVANATAVNARAPEGLDAWPSPDAVFIGGSGGELREIAAIAHAKQKPGARLVVNTITLENQALAHETMKSLGYDYDVTLVQIARSSPILDMTRFDALNPIAIFCGTKI